MTTHKKISTVIKTATIVAVIAVTTSIAIGFYTINLNSQKAEQITAVDTDSFIEPNSEFDKQREFTTATKGEKKEKDEISLESQTKIEATQNVSQPNALASSSRNALTTSEKAFIKQALALDTSDPSFVYRKNSQGQLLKVIDNNPSSPNHLKLVKTYDWDQGRVIGVSSYDYHADHTSIKQLQVHYNEQGELQTYREIEKTLDN